MGHISVRSVTDQEEAAWREASPEDERYTSRVFTQALRERLVPRGEAAATGQKASAAELDGEIVGIAHYHSHYDSASGHRDWYLDDLAVAPDERGQGAATAIVQHIMGLARAVGPGGVLRWVTDASDEQARRVSDRIAARTGWDAYEVRI